MQTRMRERSQKYACWGTNLEIRTYGRALKFAGSCIPGAGTVDRMLLCIIRQDGT